MKKIILSIFLVGTLLSANGQVPSYVPKDSLKAWYPFNGNANDESGNGNHGTVNGAAISQDRFGMSNSAYLFNGTNNYIGLPLATGKISNSNQFTISYWINPKKNNGIKTVFSHWITGGSAQNTPAGFYTNITDTNIFSNYIVGYGVGSFEKINTNSWYNIVIVYDGTQSVKTDRQKLYINGVLQSLDFQCSFCSSNIPPTLGTIASSTSIGARLINSSWTEFFDGYIDDIGIWNRALSASEIKDLYYGCKLSISTEPTSKSSSINGQVQFNTLANDTTSSYQWQSNQSNLGWVNIPSSSFYSGVTSKKLTVNNIKVKNHEQLFRVIATKNTCKDTSVVAMLTVNDTCITSTRDTLYIKVNTSSLSNPIYNTVKVYPNPSSTQVIIDNGNYNTMGNYNAKIINTAGQQVFQSVINQQQFVIDAKTMGGAGVYTLYITDANNKVVGTKKIVLQ